jgi:hypothetical protein
MVLGSVYPREDRLGYQFEVLFGNHPYHQALYGSSIVLSPIIVRSFRLETFVPCYICILVLEGGLILQITQK